MALSTMNCSAGIVDSTSAENFVTHHEGNDCSSRGAALLLMKVRNTAMSEVDKSIQPARFPRLLTPRLYQPRSTVSPFQRVPIIPSSDFSVRPEHFSPTTTAAPITRFRTVSMESMEQFSSVSPSHSQSDESDSTGPAMDVTVSPIKSPVQSPDSRRERQLVGTEVKAPLKGVLRKKYAWRDYPELEGYLVEHREQYLSFSSQLNYTAEQKLYNNRLTQGLLDLAAEVGYKFEGFSFSMLRDRIRCYYKSYVQAVKKKKKRRKN